MDLIMRHTDNPNGGSITADFPHLGGAYFDVISYHSYPHFDGSLRYYDQSVGGFVWEQHSDRAVAGYLDRGNQFMNVAAAYGYGSIYPAKKVICTETNVPRKTITYYGNAEYQKNYTIKLAVAAQKAGHLQTHLYTMADDFTEEAATYEFHVMGLFKPLGNTPPYTQQRNDNAIGNKTVSDELRSKNYDAQRTAQLNLPEGVDGAAFRDELNNYTYVLWAKTSIDQSEAANATYAFPASIASGTMEAKAWNYSVTGTTTQVNAQNIVLTGSPIFLTSTGSLAAYAGPDQSICNGESVLLTGTASGGTSPYTYNWNVGSGAQQIFSPSSTTTYFLTVTDALGATSTDEVTISVDPICYASLGDFVFEDTNENGVQDNGEPGIQAVAVTLSGTDENGVSVSLTTNTDANGGYQFANLIAGTYQLSFQTPANYDLSPANIGGNDNTDSDVDANGVISGITLTAGENNTSYDAGFIPIQIDGFTITCPADIVLTVSPGQSGANVTWELPTGLTDCPYGSIGYVQIAGPSSGSLFATGSTTTIEYYAYDGCSGSAYCTFTIQVTDQQDCGAQAGNPCDDGNACTTGDVYDSDCNCAGTLIDGDDDGICDTEDNCPNTANPNQTDTDGDGTGDACDNCNFAAGSPCDDGNACTINDVYDADCNCAGTLADSDQDGVCDAEDNCPGTPNTNQTDSDENGIGDACDESCEFETGTPCDDGNACTTGDVYDADCNCAGTLIDGDNDGICDTDDNCPNNANPNQTDTDGDGIGDACDDCNFTAGSPCNDGDACTTNDVYDEDCNCAGTLIDTDDDGICDTQDNCPNTANTNQEDTDNDGIGDVCDNCNIAAGTPCDDQNACTTNDVYDANCNCAGTLIDADNDGICDTEDNCPTTANPDQIDTDNNGVGDACDTPIDGLLLNCPADITVSVSPESTTANVNWTDPVGLSSCPWGSVGVLQIGGPSNGDLFLMGSTSVDYYAYDGCGNGANCSFTVTLVVADDCEIPEGTACDDQNACTTNDVYDANCNCAGTLIDADQDGICDTEDNCVGVFNPDQLDTDGDGTGNACDDCNFTAGTPCDDGDACTTGDVYDANCNCAGTFSDSDSDDICDGEDNCPNDFNPDQEDENNNGIGDACDTPQEEGLYLNCPADIVVNIPASASGTTVSWAPPASGSDCPWGSVGVLQIGGQESGSFFSVGSSSVSYYAYDGCGDGVTCSFVVTVIAGSSLQSSEGSQEDDRAVAKSTSKIERIDFNLFPNPASEEVTLDLSAYMGIKQTLRMNVYNISGQMVYEQEFLKLGGPIQKISLNTFDNGIYQVVISAEGEVPVTKRLVVTRQY